MGCHGNVTPAHPPDVRERVAFGELVRVPLPEDVSDAAAGEDLQAASAHPHPEGELWREGVGGGGRYGDISGAVLICIAPQTIPRQQMAASWKSAGLKLLLGIISCSVASQFRRTKKAF